MASQSITKLDQRSIELGDHTQRTGCDAHLAARDPAGRWIATAQLGLKSGEDSRLCGVDLRVAAKALKEVPFFGMEIQRLLATPDGRLIVAASSHNGRDSEIHVFEPLQGELLPKQGFRRLDWKTLDGNFSEAALSADGKWLAVGGDLGRVIVYRLGANGLLTATGFDRRVLPDWTFDPLGVLHFAREGRDLVVATRQRLQLWRNWAGGAAQPAQTLVLDGANAELPLRRPFANWPARNGGQWIALATLRSVRLYHLGDTFRQTADIAQAGARLLDLRGVAHGATSLALVAQTSEGRILHWSLTEEGERTPSDKALHDAQPAQLAGDIPAGLPARQGLPLSADAAALWTVQRQPGGSESWAVLRHWEGGDELGRLGHPNLLRQLIPHRGDVISVDSHGLVRVWSDIRIERGHGLAGSVGLRLTGLDGAALSWATAATLGMLFEPGGEVATWDDGLRQAWGRPRVRPEALKQRTDAFPDGHGCRQTMAYAPARDLVVVSATPGRLWRSEADGEWQRATERPIGGHCLGNLAFDGRGRRLAMAVQGTTPRVLVFDAYTWKVVWELPTEKLPRRVTLSEDGQRLALTLPPNEEDPLFGEGVRLELWRIGARRPLLSQPLASADRYGPLCLSPDGRWLGTGASGIAQLWEIGPGVRLAAGGYLRLSGTPQACQFSADSSRVAFLGRHGLEVMPVAPADLQAALRRRLEGVRAFGANDAPPKAAPRPPAARSLR